MCRRAIFLMLTVLMLCVTANITQADLIGHWKLDGNAADSSGNGYDGVLFGNPQWTTGRHAGALEFTGGDDRVECPGTSQSEGFAALEGEVTWAVWFKTGSPTRQTIIVQDPPGGTHVSGNRSLNVEANGTLMIRANGVGAATGFSSTASVNDDEWHHAAATFAFDTDGANDPYKVYIDGDLDKGFEIDTVNINQNAANGQNFIIIIGYNGNFPFIGQIDDVRVYDTVLSQIEIESAMTSEPFPYSFGPSPKDGDMVAGTWTTLSWNAGDFAVSHDLYIGTDFDDVNNGAEGTLFGNLTTNSQVVGFPGFPVPGGLVPGTTYYWRVDEINDTYPESPWKGDVWSFWIPPRTAYDSVPADDEINVLQDVTLNWTAGFNAQLHQVYFGETFEDVNTASGAPLLSDTTYTPNALETGKTYYWRVDEFASGVTHKGDVWSFTTVPEITVTDQNLMLWWTLDEGQGTTAVDWSGHGNHGAITGGAKWTDGYQGTALTFGEDVYVEAAGFNGITGSAPRTCCAWIRTTTANRNIMSWGQNVAGQKWRMRINGTGGLRAEVNGGYHYGVTNIADGRWHHVAVTFEDDGSPDALDTLLYVDGRLDSTSASLDEPIDTGAGPVRIGESPWHNAPFMDEIDDARIYDKVLTAEEIQQVMLGDTELAANPDPDRHTIVDIRDISSLSWSAGDTAASHDVYFGTDRDSVALADNTAPEFQGNQTETSLSAVNLVEFGGGDYYWRVDEVEADGTVIDGTIWKFTVPEYLIVDDFESYNDLAEDNPASNRVYLTWIDGFGTTTNGAVAGNLDVPLMSTGHSSAQAMPVSYDNAGKTSEVSRTLTSKKDWTEHGVTKLVVWFSGDSANAADRMYVALGNAVVYHPDDAATQDTGWNEWIIDLQEFANQGTDLTNVGSITIGFGTRNAPVASGGIGTVDIDDIRLIQ